MAETLSLVRTADFEGDISTLNLTSGFALAEWNEGTAEDWLDDNIVESLSFRLVATSDDNIATYMQSLYQKVREAGWAKKRAERYQVWLRDQLAAETGARQAVIKSIKTDVGGALHSFTVRRFHGWKGPRIAVNRGHWENTSATTLTYTRIGGINGVGGMVNPFLPVTITGEACGSMPGDGSALAYTLDFAPESGTVITLHYTDTTSKTATATFSTGVPIYLENSGDTIAVLSEATWALNVRGESTTGKADPGTAVTIDYVVYSGFAAGIPGDFPGRIGALTMTPTSGSLTELWWGFRTAEHCTLANWTGLWELENGTESRGDTALYADATASPGGGGNTAYRCNFETTAAMADCILLTPYNVDNTNFEDLRGTYQILLRAKIDSGYTCMVQLSWGLQAGNTTPTVYNDKVSVSSTAWKFYDLGRVTLPCGGPATVDYSTMRNSLMTIRAQLYSGTQNNAKYLMMDCLIAIPVDEGYGHFTNGNASGSVVLIDALGRVISQSGSPPASYGADTTGTNAKDSVIPVGASKLITAMQSPTETILTDTATIVMKVFPRWYSVRGGA